MKNNVGKVVIFFLLQVGHIACAAQDKFILITSLYNETNPVRAQEYITCMERNLSHPAIGAIHFLYDTSKDDGTNQILTYLKTKNVIIEYIVGRPTFGFIFELANRCYPNSRIIVSNADIYFNKTLHKLDSYDFTNKFFALTRWDVTNRKKLRMLRPLNWDNRVIRDLAVQSHDTWIFSTPLQNIKSDAIKFGTMGCDVLIAYQIQHTNLQLLNPSFTVQCCHLHLSGHRNYDPKDRPAMPIDYKQVGYCELG